MIFQYTLQCHTTPRAMSNITDEIRSLVKRSQVVCGLCHVFLRHTSASLILCENADLQVQYDLEAYMSRLIVEGDKLFNHTAEGPDDMPAHVRTVLTQSFQTIPITDHDLALGTWQGLYIWEHRNQSHHRKCVVTISG